MQYYTLKIDIDEESLTAKNVLACDFQFVVRHAFIIHAPIQIMKEHFCMKL